MSAPARWGRFRWYDLVTPAPAGAIAFYSQVVGWSSLQWERDRRPYPLWVSAVGPLGGVLPMLTDDSADIAPYWLAYIEVEDVSASVARARALGGVLVRRPSGIAGAGDFAVMTDPQGALFAVYRPVNPVIPPSGSPGPGEFSWHELATSDLDAALEFYSNLFGWQELGTSESDHVGRYVEYGLGAYTLGGMYRLPPEPEPRPNWLYYVKVEDVFSAVDAVREHGGYVLNGPTEIPGGDWIAQCRDPQGAAFALHSTPEAA